MNVVEAPNIWDGTIRPNERSIFLAGGISNCPDWQAELIKMTNTTTTFPITLLNPRRADFDVNDPNASEQQIRWERLHLLFADCILFWFPKETLCPITLFELGAALHSSPGRLIIGTDPEYTRREDVIIQSQLVDPGLDIYNDLEVMARQVIAYGNYKEELPKW